MEPHRKQYPAGPHATAASVGAHVGCAIPRAPPANLSLELRLAIQAQVIPRLLLRHPPAPASLPPLHLTDDELEYEVATLARLACQSDMTALHARASALLRRGLGVERLFLDVLSGAMRWIGIGWVQDRCNFLTVTMASVCLQSLLRRIADEHAGERERPTTDRRILLIPLPGEDHEFGAVLTGELFRRRGWQVEGEAMPDLATLEARVASSWYHVVGLSVASPAHLAATAQAIRMIRRKSLNQATGIMVGGCAFARHVVDIQRLGADACCTDALNAILQAEQLLAVAALSR